MKILVIGMFYSEGFALHIAETLAHMGHEVSRFEPGFRAAGASTRIGHRLSQVRGVIHSSTDSIPRIRRARMKRLWDVADEARPDAAVVCHDFLWPEEVARLKTLVSGPVSLWFPDALVNFGRGFFMNASYDALFFKDPFIVDRFGDVLRSPVHYLPECFNPHRHVAAEPTPAQLDSYECDIATAGNLHSWRVACFSHLADYRVRIWGNPAPLWMPTGPISAMQQGRGVYNSDKALAFRSARIVLNNLHYGEMWGVNVRCFEAAGCGAFQMVDWRPGLSQLFEDGKELVSFRSMRELREKVAYWLPEQEERRAVAEAGRRRAQAEHTYEKRLRLLLDTAMGKDNGFPMPVVECLTRVEKS